MHVSKARWVMADPVPESYESHIKNLHPVVTQILYNRGIGFDDIDAFLDPSSVTSHSPHLLLGMGTAVKRMKSAIAAGENIAVYGDFDVDGMTSSVVLYETIVALGGRCTIYIPHRNTEGYGLNPRAIEKLRAEGVSLIVTVDCGISSVAEVDFARSLGVDVIITDHHVPPEVLPDALAVINPRQTGCTYPFKDLAGVGVAFKVASALTEGLETAQTMRRRALDLVAIGTIADMVPLRGENRTFVHYGLPLITHTARVGLRTLLSRANLDHTDVTSSDVGFKIAPRLNAAGRIDHAVVGCNLLMTKDDQEADRLADALEEKNQERQTLTSSILDDARERIGADPTSIVLVLDDPDWPVGVVGLVAGRLADEYCRPTLIIERGDTESRGSARSIAGFSMIEALGACDDILTKYGGHAGAAGFTVPTASIPELASRMCTIAEHRLTPDNLVATIAIDAEISGRDMNKTELQNIYEQVVQLEPFGMGNSAPLLLRRNLRVVEARTVGQDHLRLVLDTGHQTISAIGFGLAHMREEISRGTVLDAVFNLQYNNWNGKSVVELRLKDIALKPPGSADSAGHDKSFC